jgi:hypothetical protein
MHTPKVLGVVYESKGKNQIIEKMRYDMRMYLNNFLHTGLSPRTAAIKTFCCNPGYCIVRKGVLVGIN